MDKILFPCKSGCGAPDGVDYTEAQDGVALCHYCGNKNAVPRKQLPDEAVRDLYNADHELFLCRFEDAREIYTKVIATSPEEPQAYLGRALAKFRVKYLKDERDSAEGKAKCQPICYGTTDKLFSKDPDYVKALELATDKQKDVYAAQAREIDAIVTNFQALKDKGIDYDTFICCKVTDNNGGYTSDCTDAQRIYHDLQKKGFKPFFSEMDMGDFTGSEYEAVILYALYTSESMLIVCSNEDYLETPWVKNEYSRFLAMTANGYKQQGSLTFVYNRAPIEKLPNGKKIQGIDRSAYGSSEKIVDFVRKYLPQSQSDTKFCAKCGNECRGSAKMCDECGSREFVDTHDEFVKVQALAQARKEQQAREELLKKQQQEREEQLQKQQAEREEQLKKQQQEREEQWRKRIEEQQSREALLKKQQQEREEQLKKQQAAREEQLRREQQARDEELAALRRQLEEERNRKTQDAAAALAAQRAKEESERKAKEEAARKAKEESERKAREEAAAALAAQRAKAEAERKAKEEAERKAQEQSRANAEAEKYLKFKLNKDYKSYSVIGHNGHPTAIAIPAQYKGLPVTKIGNDAFHGCLGLISVTIPSSVTSIGWRAFYRCSLTSITIPSSVTSIGSDAFEECTSLTSITIPSSVTRIGDEVFKNCSSLQYNVLDGVNYLGNDDDKYIVLMGVVDKSQTSYKIHESTKMIYSSAFRDCSNLTVITIPSSVTQIGIFAFSSCSNLTSITIPNSVTSIGDKAFSGCSSLISIIIPSSVTNIGEWAFANCSSLKSITIPSSVKRIDSFAFDGCSSLTTITIPSSVTGIDSYAFRGCSSLKSIVIPSSVTKIGGGVFADCGNLTTLEVQKGNPAYYSKGNCLIETTTKTLMAVCKKFVIPNDCSITSIGYSVFSGCRSLTSLNIPSGVTDIGWFAFENCSGLKSITIPSSVKRIDSFAFKGCNSLKSIVIPSSVTCIGQMAFFGCSSLKSIVIPSSVTSINVGVFANCGNLATLEVQKGNPAYYSQGNCLIETETKTLMAVCKKFVIPNDGSIARIGESAFHDCRSLTSLNVPSGVTEICWFAFCNCSRLRSITIPNSVTDIDKGAFCNCSSLKSITIPSSVTNIDGRAFDGCSKLTQVTMPEHFAVYTGELLKEIFGERYKQIKFTYTK